MEDDQNKQSPIPLMKKTFNYDLDPSNPLGFLEKAFEFVAKETGMFNIESVPEDVDAIVRKLKDKLEAEKIRDKELVEKKIMEAPKKEEIMEDQKGPSSSARNTFQFDLNLSNPLGFLERAFEFVAKETDLFNSDSLLKDVNAVVRKVKYKEDIMEDMKEKGKEEKDPQEPEEDEPFDFLDERDSIEACRICPLKYNFKTACSCKECRPKIEELTGFEENIKNKKVANEDLFYKVEEIKDMCSNCLAPAAHETKWMLYMIHKQLNQLNKKSGVPMVPKRSRQTVAVCADIYKSLEKLGFDPIDQVSYQKTIELIDKCDLSKVIDTAKYYYGKTKVKGLADPILEKMESIEKKKKSHLNSTKHLEEQVKLVRDLPIRHLQREVQAAIGQICPYDPFPRNYLKVRNFIEQTLEGMIRKSFAFWNGYRKHPSRCHSSNGLDKTLDRLINEVKLFEKEWELNYASLVENYFDHPDPKKQRIE